MFCCFTLVSQFCLFCNALFCALGFRPVHGFIFYHVSLYFHLTSMPVDLLANSGIFIKGLGLEGKG